MALTIVRCWGWCCSFSKREPRQKTDHKMNGDKLGHHDPLSSPPMVTATFSFYARENISISVPLKLCQNFWTFLRFCQVSKYQLKLVLKSFKRKQLSLGAKSWKLDSISIKFYGWHIVWFDWKIISQESKHLCMV